MATFYFGQNKQSVFHLQSRYNWHINHNKHVKDIDTHSIFDGIIDRRDASLHVILLSKSFVAAAHRVHVKTSRCDSLCICVIFFHESHFSCVFFLAHCFLPHVTGPFKQGTHFKSTCFPVGTESLLLLLLLPILSQRKRSIHHLLRHHQHLWSIFVCVFITS